MPEHDQARDLEHLDAEFERGAGAVMTRVGSIARHQRRDIADHEQFARHGAEHRLRVDARIRAGDDHRLRTLAPVSQGLVARPLGRPDVGAKAAIAFDERVHGASWKCCIAIGRPREGRKDAAPDLGRRGRPVEAPEALGRPQRLIVLIFQHLKKYLPTNVFCFYKLVIRSSIIREISRPRRRS